MFGGVPILTEPVGTPSLAYTRDSRADVYRQCVEDFEFASQYLPISVSEPGRVVRAAACHYLAEMYIALGDETGDKSHVFKGCRCCFYGDRPEGGRVSFDDRTLWLAQRCGREGCVLGFVPNEKCRWILLIIVTRRAIKNQFG